MNKSPTIQPAAFDGWNTPPEILALVRKLAGGQIALDPCSNDHSQTEPAIRGLKENDGLGATWDLVLRRYGLARGLIFVNPPFDHKTLARVVNSCIAYSHPAQVVLLAPTKSDQDWFQRSLRTAQACCFIGGRVKFWREGKPSPGSAFACVLFYWGPNAETFNRIFKEIGACLDLHRLEEIDPSVKAGVNPCISCGTTTKERSPCPLCYKVYCQRCAERPYAFCCDNGRPL